MGAWIEIINRLITCFLNPVAPHVGAWIEIFNVLKYVYHNESLPTWERGLKFLGAYDVIYCPTVAPHVGAWIEIGGG